ncbi:MAG: hypothetical protein ACAH88_16930, partial [Roseimicrobium sp.]
IFAHEEKIVSLSSAKHEWNNRAADYRRQAGSASLAGRPTYNFTQQAKQAEQNADATAAQIELIKAEIRKLRQKLQ